MTPGRAPAWASLADSAGDSPEARSGPASCAPCPGAGHTLWRPPEYSYPRTITALRTRRYTSTLYIRHTIHGVGYNPYEWRRTVQFATAVSQRLPARMGHYIAPPFTGQQGTVAGGLCADIGGLVLRRLRRS